MKQITICFIIYLFILSACEEPHSNSHYVENYTIRVGEFVGKNYGILPDTLLKVIYYPDSKKTKQQKMFSKDVRINSNKRYSILFYRALNDTVLLTFSPEPYICSPDSDISLTYPVHKTACPIYIIGNISTNEIYYIYDSYTSWCEKEEAYILTDAKEICEGNKLGYISKEMPVREPVYHCFSRIKIKEKIETDYLTYIRSRKIKPDLGELKFQIFECSEIGEKILRTYRKGLVEL